MAMVFEDAAQPLQLVLGGRETDPRVDLVDGIHGQKPRAFETSKRWVPRLGSSTLLELAGAMRTQGAKVMRFDVRDLRLNPIDRADAERISGRLIGAIESGGTDEANRLLETQYRDYLINSLEVLVGSRRATVERHGIVFTSNRDGFLRLLQRIWPEAVGS